MNTPSELARLHSAVSEIHSNLTNLIDEATLVRDRAYKLRDYILTYEYTPDGLFNHLDQLEEDDVRLRRAGVELHIFDGLMELRKIARAKKSRGNR